MKNIIIILLFLFVDITILLSSEHSEESKSVVAFDSTSPDEMFLDVDLDGTVIMTFRMQRNEPVVFVIIGFKKASVNEDVELIKINDERGFLVTFNTLKSIAIAPVEDRLLLNRNEGEAYFEDFNNDRIIKKAKSLGFPVVRLVVDRSDLNFNFKKIK